MCHKGEGATNREVVQQCVIRERGGATNREVVQQCVIRERGSNK